LAIQQHKLCGVNYLATEVGFFLFGYEASMDQHQQQPFLLVTMLWKMVSLLQEEPG